MRFSNRKSVEKIVLGCLKSALTAHGPITKENYSSAAKRITSQLCEQLWHQKNPDDVQHGATAAKQNSPAGGGQVDPTPAKSVTVVVGSGADTMVLITDAPERRAN